MGVAYRDAQTVKVVVQFLIVSTEIDDTGTFFFYQRFDGVVVVAFILSTDNENHLCLHRLECVPAGIDIGCLGVVDVLHTSYRTHFLQTMFYAREVAETLSDILFLDTSYVRGNTCSQRVIDIMLTGKAQTFLFHIEGLRLLNMVLALFNITDNTCLLQFCEGVLDSLDIVFFEFSLDDGVVSPVDESIVFCLILYDTHLGIYVVLHLKVVAVQMVRRDIQEDGNVCSEVIHVVELEGTQFDDVVFMRLFCHLQRQRVADISRQSCIIACLLEDMVDKRCRRGLTI